MAQQNTEIQAIADVYAEGLLEAADEKGQAEQVAAEFADLIAYMDRNPDFDVFMTAESVDDDPRHASLEKLFRGRMNDLLLNLLQVLNKRSRCSLIRGIQRGLEIRIKERHQQIEVVVETALPLTDDLRDAIAEDVGQWMEKKALLIEKVNPDLIGGVVIHVGDIRIDGSVASSMHAICRRLYERAIKEINSGRGYSVEA
ncbi:MAG: ATP synthase F1 subunit delta [Planctomycetota bacterium]|nr:MAG: ATP synthase F1 subunit delta [Planctomycetota bacterium]